MRIATLIFCLVSQAVFGQAYSFHDLAWLGSRPLAPGFVSPTNLPGIVADFDASTLPAGTAVNAFTDLVGGVVAMPPAAAPTNYGIGIYTSSEPGSFTNLPITLGSNFTLEVIFRLTPALQPSNLPGSTPSSVTDNEPRVLVGTPNGDGLVISNGFIAGNWGTSYNVSGAMFPTTNWVRPTWDIVDAGGTLYTNGVACGLGVGQPTNGFPFASIGCANINLNAIGYFQTVRLWSNTLTAPQVASIYNWNLTNGAVDVTNGLLARWKLDDATGTTISDSVGNYPAQMIPEPSGYPLWTNGLFTVNNNSNNGALYFNSNYVASANSTNLMNNFTNGTIAYWYKSSQPNLVYTYDNILFSKFTPTQLPVPTPGWAVFLEEFNNVIDMTFYLSVDSQDYIECAWAFPNDDAWHFVVDEVTTNYPVVYVDGELVITNNYSAYVIAGTVTNFSSITTEISLGYDAANDAYSTSIFLDDIEFYNRLLTQKDMAEKLQEGPK
jgi:hypothetical protein